MPGKLVTTSAEDALNAGDIGLIVFLDFEASSLSKKSYPIEVAWIFENGQSRSALIRPAPDWTDWSPEAEAIHGIPRQRLLDEGVSVDTIATEMIDALSGHKLYASAPSWDGKWLSVLLRAAGYPRHALRLARSEEAFFDAARLAAGANLTDGEISALVATILLKTEPIALLTVPCQMPCSNWNGGGRSELSAVSRQAKSESDRCLLRRSFRRTLPSRPRSVNSHQST